MAQLLRDENVYPDAGGWRAEVMLYPNDPHGRCWHYLGIFSTRAAAVERVMQARRKG